MLSPLAHRLVRGTLALAVTISVAALGVAVADAATTPRVAVTALEFEQPTVDPSGESWSNRLTWTITNTDPDVWVNGAVTMRMRSSVTGELLGHEWTVRYWFNDTCCQDAQFVSGTPEESTYSYELNSFGAPNLEYSDAATATWEVTKITIVAGATTTAVGGTRLHRFGYRFTALTRVDTTGPTVEFDDRPSPYVYAGNGQAAIDYRFTVRDDESGFWKGRIRLAGPDGATATARFTWERDPSGTGTLCGGGYEPIPAVRTLTCSVGVSLPAGVPDGTWRVAAVVLHDNAGAMATHRNPTAPSAIVTSNSRVRASDFAISPNPVDNWRDDAVTELTMSVTGARRGISSVTVDFDFDNMSCHPSGAFTVEDGRISVPLTVQREATRCSVDGIRLIDGAGNVALYGRKYFAPNLGLEITQISSTHPPVVLGATLTPSSLPASQLAEGRSVIVTMQTEVRTVPITGSVTYLYDEAGGVIERLISGATQAADGTVRQGLFLPSIMAPGEYTVGFTLTDGSGRSSSWNVPEDPDSQTLPSGPLILTITEG
jgi:hypothetical protein